jgi:hypothetical protein
MGHPIATAGSAAPAPSPRWVGNAPRGARPDPRCMAHGGPSFRPCAGPTSGSERSSSSGSDGLMAGTTSLIVNHATEARKISPVILSEAGRRTAPEARRAGRGGGGGGPRRRQVVGLGSSGGRNCPAVQSQTLAVLTAGKRWSSWWTASTRKRGSSGNARRAAMQRMSSRSHWGGSEAEERSSSSEERGRVAGRAQLRVGFQRTAPSQRLPCALPRETLQVLQQWRWM